MQRPRDRSYPPSWIIQVLSCHGPCKPQRVTSEPLLKDDLADYQPGLIVDGSLLMAVTPSPVMMVQRPFLENDSLTSIERSPTLSYRPVDTKETPYSSSVPANSCHLMRQQPSWLNPQVRRATTSNLPAMSAAGWNFNPLQHYPVETDDVFTEYSNQTNQLVAPIATPETLSEESAGGSISSLAKRAHKFLRRDRSSSSGKRKDSPHQPVQQYSCSSSDLYEMTESSSVYCASPLSSARTTSGQTRASRAQLKREIMRLYQRAAADVDKVEPTPPSEQPNSSSISSHSRSASSSSPSQPSRLFPVLDPMSPVFGVRNGSSSNSGNQSRYAISPVASRPATANGGTGRRLSPSNVLPPCNTSF